MSPHFKVIFPKVLIVISDRLRSPYFTNLRKNLHPPYKPTANSGMLIYIYIYIYIYIPVYGISVYKCIYSNTVLRTL